MNNYLTNYIEFKLLENTDININVLRNQLFFQVHRAIVPINGRAAISFPGYDDNESFSLGNTLRVFGSNTDLANFLAHLSISSIRDYVDISGINNTPSKCQYISYSRVQKKGSSALRRFIKRNKLSESDARDIYDNGKKTYIDLPYINYYSTSTKNFIKVFISKSLVINEPKNGVFSSFGLGKEGATVPHF